MVCFVTIVIDHGQYLCEYEFMADSTVQASKFKANCLAILDEVEATRATFTVTKHGRPVARLVPLEEPRTLMGSVTLLSDDDEDYFSTGEAWDVS